MKLLDKLERCLNRFDIAYIFFVVSMTLFIASIVIGSILVCYAATREQVNWDRFFVEHNCKQVGFVEGGVQAVLAPVVGTNGYVHTGLVTVITPEKTGYSCDDGVTYWR